MSVSSSVSDCDDSFIRQQGHSGAVGQYDAPSIAVHLGRLLQS